MFDVNLPKVSGFSGLISLKGGLAGKICYVLISLILGAIGVCFSSKPLWFLVVLIVIMTLIILIVVSLLFVLALKNPAAALLDSADFIQHEVLLMGTKDRPILNMVSDRVTPHPISPPTPNEEKIIQSPDIATGKGA